MDRVELFTEIVNVLNLDEELVNENTLLDDIEFDSIAKLGVISVIDTYLDKIIDATLLSECKTIGDIVNLAFSAN